MEDYSYLFPEESLSPERCNGTKVSKISEDARRNSVSFGRFSSDSLDWGKWSIFCQKKHLEEIEMCLTPGSVAKKKAFFEARQSKSLPSKSLSFLEEDNVSETENDNNVSHAQMVHNLKQNRSVHDALNENKKSSFSSLKSSTDIIPDFKGESSHRFPLNKNSKTPRSVIGIPKHGSNIVHSPEQGRYSNHLNGKRNQSKAETASSSFQSRAIEKAEKPSKASQKLILCNREGRKNGPGANSSSSDLPPLQPSITSRFRKQESKSKKFANI